MAAPSRERAAGSTDSRHYSYEVYADARMAESFDELRFGGPVGRLIAESQEAVIAAFLDPVAGSRVLDVGTGTGRAALALAKRGAVATGVDASDEMLAVARRRAVDAGANVEFRSGDVHSLPFEPRSFDTVVCLRVLMHTPDWRKALAELCRVADRRVVFDYPALSSAAAIQAAARRLANAAGSNTEAYRVFSDSSINSALTNTGFAVVRIHRQFVLPIALHKRIGSPAFTNRIEHALERAGLNRLLGSPVTVLAERCAS